MADESEDTVITLDSDQSAIVFDKDGEYELIIPQSEDEQESNKGVIAVLMCAMMLHTEMLRSRALVLLQQEIEKAKITEKEYN